MNFNRIMQIENILLLQRKKGWSISVHWQDYTYGHECRIAISHLLFSVSL